MDEIVLTKQQVKCIDYEGGDLLVKGVAGSGKSFVILSRAKKAYDKYPDAKIAIFTFQNTLVDYTKSLLQLQLKENSIDVFTIDSYCRNLYLEMSGLPQYTKISKISNELIEKVLAIHQNMTLLNHRLYRTAINFWIDEFNWIRGKCIETKEEYLSAERSGRGSQIRVTRMDRGLIWGVYLILLQEMQKDRIRDWYDIYIYLNKHIDKIPENRKIDYVFVDEAQDMTLGKMKILKALTRKTITIAADIAQKIHKTSFTWKEVGIDISGSGSKSLSKSFRSTRQIVLLAEDLMLKNRHMALQSEEYTEAVLPDVNGLIPQLCICKTVYKQNGYIKSLVTNIDLNSKRVAIIVYTNKELDTIKRSLYSMRIPYQYIDPQKSDWNILEPGVKIVKAFSSKGLEFDYVIIPYLTDQIYPLDVNQVDNSALDEYLCQQRSVLYVAMTRARIGLVMLTIQGQESRFIQDFNPEHYKIEYID